MLLYSFVPYLPYINKYADEPQRLATIGHENINYHPFRVKVARKWSCIRSDELGHIFSDSPIRIVR